MPSHDFPPLPEAQFEPSQEELKNLHDILFETIQSPNPRHMVDSSPNLPGSAILHRVILSSLDALEVTRDPATDFVKATAQDILKMDDQDRGSAVIVLVGEGEPDSPRVSTSYWLERTYTFRGFKYTLSKTLPWLEGEEADQEESADEIFDDEDDEDLIDAMDEIREEAERITPEDVAMLGRLATVLSSDS